MFKYLFAILVAGCVITGARYFYVHRHELFRPDFDRTGGTLLIFEIDGEQPAGGLDDLLDVLQKRFDPGHGEGVVVRVDEEGRVELGVPFGKLHDDLVETIKRLAPRSAAAELRVVANRTDDEPVCKVVDVPVKGAKLDVPPPTPRNAHGGEEFLRARSITARSRYRWMPLGEGQVKFLLLDRLSLTRENPADRPKVEDSLRKGVPFSPTFYMNQAVIQARQLKPLPTDPALFVLVREPAENEDVRLGPVENIRASGGRGRSVIAFRISKTTGNRLFELVQNNTAMPIGTLNWQVMLLLDGEAVGAPFTSVGNRRDLQLHGDFSASEAEDLVILLRGGPLPCRLKFLREIGMSKKK